jgi:hypothetical protein
MFEIWRGDKFMFLVDDYYEALMYREEGYTVKEIYCD